MDLLTLTTEDNLWTLQPQLLALQRQGAISVTGTMDTAGFDYDGVASLHADSHADLRGDVQLVSGSGVTLSQVGQAITITNTGTVSTGNLTDTGTDGITVTGGTGAVIGSGTSLAQHVADTSHNGYLSSTDWTTFNGKGNLAGSTTQIQYNGGSAFAASSQFTVALPPSGIAELNITEDASGDGVYLNLNADNGGALRFQNKLGDSGRLYADIYWDGNRSFVMKSIGSVGVGVGDIQLITESNGNPNIWTFENDGTSVMAGQVVIPSAHNILFQDAGGHSVTIGAPVLAVTASYSLLWPTSQASFAGQVLVNDGSGNLSWTDSTSTPRTAAQRDAIGTPATATATVVDYTALSGAVLTVHGKALTEGVEWGAVTSNNQTASNIATAITTNAASTFCHAVAIGNVVTITALVVVGSNAITLTTSDGTNLPVTAFSGEVDPADGLTIYNTDTHEINYFNNTAWQKVSHTNA